MPRALVVERVHRSPPLLTLLCDAAVTSPTCATTTGFVCVVLTELLAAHAPPEDSQLATLLPLLQAALSAKAPVEFQAGALMVLAQLGCGTVLADAVVAQLLSAVVKGAHESLRAQALQLCLLYCRSQSLTALPAAALAHLVKWGELATLAGRLCGECDASALLTPLLQVLVRRVSSSHHASLLRELLALPALPPPAAAAAAAALLDALTESIEDEIADEGDMTAVAALREALTALALSHAAQTNHAVKRLVERAPKSERKALAAKLASLLRGSAAAPITDSGRDGVVTLMEVRTNALLCALRRQYHPAKYWQRSRVSLLSRQCDGCGRLPPRAECPLPTWWRPTHHLMRGRVAPSSQSADSAVAAVREAAVEPLAALVTATDGDGGDGGDGAWARHMLLRLLDDDAPGPAAAVLGCGGALFAALLPAEQLVSTLLQRMHTAARLAVRMRSPPAAMAQRHVA